MTAVAFRTRDRDAWATIRGFVFQVTQTVLRWIELGPQDALELERGEDIDLCCNAVSSTADAQAMRLLEQLKHRESRISLRSPAVAEFLANACEHRAVNVGMQLRFRLVSTASPALEKPTPLSPRVPAIAKWMEVTASPLIDAKAVEAIRGLLSAVDKPNRFPDDVWARYQGFLKATTPTQFLDFMRQVEWALEQGEVEEVRQRAQAELVARRLADAASAEGHYKRLFFEVFERLSRPGLKRITLEELTRSLATPLDPSSEARFAALGLRLTLYQERLSEAEATLATHSEQIRKLAEAQGPQVRLSVGSEQQGYDEAPPLVARRARREAAKIDVIRRLTSHQIVVLTGEPGYGKTQLARLVAEGQPHAWVRLSRAKADELPHLIRDAVEYAVGQKRLLVVLDSLPGLGQNELVEEALLRICDTPVRVLVTSTRELPARLTQNLAQSCDHFALPPFQPGDIRDVVQAAQAPEPLCSQGLLELFASATAGHPTLVQALVAYLSQNGWKLNETRLREIFRGHYAEKVREDMTEMLAATVADAPSRELLYRLDLVDGPARRAEVEALAAVSAAIMLPYEKLSAVRGVWVRQDTEDRVLLSPLLMGSGRKQLPLVTVKAVHLALSEVALVAGSISVDDLRSCLWHLLAAGEVDRAGIVYAMAAWDFATKAAPASGFPWLVHGWPQRLPKEMSIGTRALIHGAHLQVADRSGLDAAPHLAEILRIAASADLEALSASDLLGLFSASGVAGPFRGKTPVGAAIALAQVSSGCLERISAVVPEAATAEIRESVNVGLWLAGGGVKTPRDMQTWLVAVSAMAPEAARRAIEALELAPQIMSFTPRVLVLEVSRTTQDWGAVDRALDAWEEAGRRLGQPLFAAGALSARIVMRNEFMKDSVSAERVGAEGLSKEWASADAEFVVRVAYGNALADAALLDVEKTGAAIDALERAVDLPANIDAPDRLRALLRLSAMSQHQPERSIAFARRAVTICNTATELPWTEGVKANAELGLAIAHKGDTKAAFDAFATAARDLTERPLVHDDEKGLFVWMGHTIGYYTNMAVAGQPPTGTADEGEYTEPPRGLFLNDPTRPAQLFQPQRLALMAAHMEDYARATGRIGEATDWGRRATELVESTADDETRALLARNSLPFLLIDNEFDFAMRGAVGAANIAPGREGPLRPLDAEAFGRWLAFLPAFTRVFDLALREDAIAPVATVPATVTGPPRARG
jgi:hypothetical protein